VLPLIYSSGPAQFEHLFTQPGKPAQDFLHWAFATGVGLFGYHIYTVAVVDLRPVAVGAAYGRRQAKALERQLTFQIILFYGLFSAWSVLKHTIELDALTPFPERDMQHQIMLARAKGYRRCALVVASTNPGAQALYERLGFTITQEHR